MVRFGQALGARAETMSGLSGLGDLILTCSSVQSRNMSLGQALGEGRALAEVLEGPPDPERLPSQRLLAHEGASWLVDAAAASRLRGDPQRS